MKLAFAWFCLVSVFCFMLGVYVAVHGVLGVLYLVLGVSLASILGWSLYQILSVDDA